MDDKHVYVYMRLHKSGADRGAEDIDYIMLYLQLDHCLDELKALMKGMKPQRIVASHVATNCGWEYFP